MGRYKLVSNGLTSKRVNKSKLGSPVLSISRITNVYERNGFFYVCGYDADFICSDFETARKEAICADRWAKSSNS